MGGDQPGLGDVDDPGGEDEVGPRVHRSVEHGRAGRAQAGGRIDRSVALCVSVRDRRIVADRSAFPRASACRGGLDATWLPFERAVMDGRIGDSGGSRGGLSGPRSATASRSSVPAIRPSGAPSRSPSGVERLNHLAKAGKVAFVVTNSMLRAAGWCRTYLVLSNDRCDSSTRQPPAGLFFDRSWINAMGEHILADSFCQVW